MSGKDEKLAILRTSIIGVMGESKDEWITTETILDNMNNGNALFSKVSIEKIGNNLRVLKSMGIIEDTKIRGRRHWHLTGKKFVSDPPVKMVISFPNVTHKSISEVSKKQGISKTDFIIQSVENNLP